MTNNINKCTFCNRLDRDVSHFFCSKTKEILICDFCIFELNQYSEKKGIIEEDYTPRSIFKTLKEYIIGQDEVIKEISVVLFKHIINISNKEIRNIKNNVLMIGPTGCGKTYIMEVAAKLLGVPILVVDSTILTATGYVGDDVEQMLSRLIKKSNNNIIKAERGIIFLDEIDKLTKRDTQNNTKDIGGEAVQQELLRTIEGAKMEINLDSRRPFGKMANIDTSNILFIGGGAFSGIDKIINRNHNTDISPMLKTQVESSSTNLSVIIRNSLIEYGIIPELAARFSTVSILKKLTREDIQKLLRNKRGRIENYIELFNKYNIHIEVDDGVYDFITEHTIQLDTGARGINYIVDRIFNHYLYNLEDYKEHNIITITVNDAENIICSNLFLT